MSLKSIVKRVLLFPIGPGLMRLYLGFLRSIAYLPKRIELEWPPRSILVVSLTTYVGDTLMTIPTLDALHRVLPDTRIDVIAEPSMDRLLRALPYLRHVYTFVPATSKIPFVSQYLRLLSMFQFAHHELKRSSYDLALIPRSGEDPFLSVYMASMSSAVRRCGHDPNASTVGVQFIPGMKTMLTSVAKNGTGIAEGVRQQLVLHACGITDEMDSVAEEHRVVDGVVAITRSVDKETLFEQLQISRVRPIIVFAPGASHPSRRWPIERFAALSVALSIVQDAAFYSVGGPGDRQIGLELEQKSDGLVRNLCGITSIPETLALIECAALLVSNDSGPAHMGGSVGAPTLVLSACPKSCVTEHASSPSRVRPVGPRVMVMQPDYPASGCGELCSAVSAHCILGLSTKLVVAKSEALLRYSGRYYSAQ